MESKVVLVDVGVFIICYCPIMKTRTCQMWNIPSEDLLSTFMSESLMAEIPTINTFFLGSKL